MSVEMERRAGCGGSGCDSKISVDVDIMCVVNEGLGEAMKMLGRPSGRLTKKLVARTVHGNQGWVRFPSRAPHLPGVVTYNAVLLPCLNAKIRMSVDILCRMKSTFMSLVAHCIGAAKI